MMPIKRILPFVLAACAAVSAFGAPDDPFNSSRVSTGGRDNNAFNRNRANNFNDYRTSLNAEYARMLGERWGNFNSVRGEKAPDRDVPPVPPVIWDGKDDRRDDREIVIEEVVKPQNDRSKANPIAPVKEDADQPTKSFAFEYFGTPLSVRVPSNKSFRLSGTSGQSIAAAWNELSDPAFACIVADVSKLKSKHRLCDWAYLKMLEAFSSKYAADPNSATLLMAYLYSQSGYKVRLATTSASRLDMLYATQHTLYDKIYYNLDGEKFYPYHTQGGSLEISAARFPKEQSLSLWVQNEPEISVSASNSRNLKSKRYPEMEFTVSTNKNLVNFYDTYPTSESGGNFLTRWAMYANTPLSKHVRDSLYPQMKAKLSGLSELEAVERILNWVQTAFVYEYDDKVWGGDRAFFAEETLFYPYCDCEDRSILFTRLVRDLLGLKCILIYYPGHLAAAVSFNSAVNGDYISHAGRRFTITDPTYIGARVGATMPKMDNATAKVILLD